MMVHLLTKFNSKFSVFICIIYCRNRFHGRPCYYVANTPAMRYICGHRYSDVGGAECIGK